MSLILDALNRSRQDQQAFPDIASEHYTGAETGRSAGWQLLPWLALALALVVVAWLLWERNPVAQVVDEPLLAQSQESAPGPASTVQLASPASQPVVAPAPVAEPLITPVAEPGLQPEPDKEPQAQLESAGRVNQGSSSANATTSSAAPVDPGVAALYQQAASATVDAPRAPDAGTRAQGSSSAAARAKQLEEQPIDIEALLSETRREMENTELEEHDAPMISTLSQQTKDRIPTIFYQQHDYSGDSAKSTVTLNGKPLRPGSSFNGGLKVVEILPDSVVLEFQGTRFRLRAMNSWVNL